MLLRPRRMVDFGDVAAAIAFAGILDHRPPTPTHGHTHTFFVCNRVCVVVCVCVCVCVRACVCQTMCKSPNQETVTTLINSTLTTKVFVGELGHRGGT